MENKHKNSEEFENDINNFVELNEAFKNCTKETKEHIKNDIKNFTNLIPQLSALTSKMVRNGLQQQVNRINKEFGEIDSQNVRNEIELGLHEVSKRLEINEWEQENSNRSKIVKNAVTNTKNRKLDKKVKKVERAIKITSVVGKGLALFGKKGLADKMQKAVVSKSKKYISKDSRIGNIMQRAAETGFTIADGARYVKDTTIVLGEYSKDVLIEKAGDAKKAGARLAKESVQTMKKGALEFGKATYKGAATTVAIAALPLEAIAAGAVWSVDKVGDKILEGVEVANSKISEAKAKVSENKTKASKGIKSVIRGFASSVVEKLSKSIEKDDEKLKQFEEPEKVEDQLEVDDGIEFV